MGPARRRSPPTPLLLAVAVPSGQAHVTPMSMRSILLNVLWLAFGGLEAAVAWGVAAVIMTVTMIGIPGLARPSILRFTRCCRSARRQSPAIRYWFPWRCRKCHLVGARGLVARALPLADCYRPRRHHHRPTVRVGSRHAGYVRFVVH